MLQYHFAAWILALLFFSNTTTADTQVLKFTSIADSVNTQISEVIVRQAYRQLNIDIEIIPLPAERSIRVADSGELDGELYRISGMTRYYPNLQMIPVPVNYLEAAVFTLQPQQQISSWEQLKPLKVAVRRGVKFSERATQDMTVEIADSNHQLFQMLLAKRADVVVIAHLNGLELIKRKKLKGIYKAGVIDRYPLYHYINNRHQRLIPAIQRALNYVANAEHIRRLRQQQILSRAIKP